MSDVVLQPQAPVQIEVSLADPAFANQLNQLAGMVTEALQQISQMPLIDQVSDVPDLDNQLSQKAALSHTHGISDVTGLNERIQPIENQVTIEKTYIAIRYFASIGATAVKAVPMTIGASYLQASNASWVEASQSIQIQSKGQYLITTGGTLDNYTSSPQVTFYVLINGSRKFTASNTFSFSLPYPLEANDLVSMEIICTSSRIMTGQLLVTRIY